MFSSLIRDLYDPFEYRHNLIPSLLLDDYTPRHQTYPHIHLNVIRPRRQTSSTSEIRPSNDANKFQVMLNVQHFQPNEVDVKTVDNYIVIHGKHEEHADEHGFVSREFTRRYQLPDDVEPEKVTSSLSRDGVLTIQAPRNVQELPKNERVVPITIQKPAAVEEAQKQQQQLEQQSAQQQSEQMQE